MVGDIILDRYVYGDTTRISPEAPVPVVKVSDVEERPGGAANVATNIAALGPGVGLLGITGNDEYAGILEKQLAKAGVDRFLIGQDGFPTVTKLRVLSQNQQLLRLDYEASELNLDANIISEKYRELLSTTDVVVISDYAKGSIQSPQLMIDAARSKNLQVLVDPKSSDFSRYRRATMLTPNLKEFLAVVGPCENEEEFDEKAKQLCETLELEGLLVTRGKDGMSLYRRGSEEVVHQAALAHEVYDVTGAGDTVIAVFASSLASSYEMEQAIVFANTAAGLAVEKLGAACISLGELNHSLSEQGVTGLADGICTSAEIENLLVGCREQGQKIVMTNGCFDIIHAGHVDYLQKAKRLGHRLIVAVNDDDSVKRLKGNDRPINPLSDRMKVLSGLASTDWVCSFSEDTPERLIRELKPDVLVKGADYQVDEIVGGEFVKSYGGEIVRIAFENSSSTSNIIKRISGGNPGEQR